jgi:hypothetical protein
MKKSLLLIGVLSLSSLAFAGTKKYDISLSVASKVGTVKLAPGAYKMQIDGDKAIFTDAKNKTVTVPVKLETSPTKFSATSVEASSKGGEETIEAIDLAGTTTKVEF